MSPLTKYMLRKLGQRPFITVLTIGSLALTAFALVAVGATLFGLRKTFANTGVASRVLVFPEGAGGEDPNGQIPPESMTKLQGLEEVKRATGVKLFRLAARNADFTLEWMSGRGLDETAMGMYGPQIVRGRMPAKGADELIVGSSIVGRHPELDVGAKMRVGRRMFEIVGVFHAGNRHDGEVFSSRDAIAQIQKSNDSQYVLIETESPAAAGALLERLRKFPSLHLEAMQESAYYTSEIKEYEPVILSVLMVLGLIVLGAALTAVCALSVIYTQRVGDIAVLRSLGFKNARVFGLVLTETEVQALSGGVLGLLLAFALVHNHTAYIMSGNSSIAFVTQLGPGLVAGTMAVMFVIGFVAMLIAISRALRFEIKDALRE